MGVLVLFIVVISAIITQQVSFNNMAVYMSRLNSFLTQQITVPFYQGITDLAVEFENTNANCLVVSKITQLNTVEFNACYTNLVKVLQNMIDYRNNQATLLSFYKEKLLDYRDLEQYIELIDLPVPNTLNPNWNIAHSIAATACKSVHCNQNMSFSNIYDAYIYLYQLKGMFLENCISGKKISLEIVLLFQSITISNQPECLRSINVN